MKYLKNFIDLFESLESSEDRIHFSGKKINTLKNTIQKDKPEFKPQGLWYAFGDDWGRFSDDFRDNDYKYKIILKEGSESKILKITSLTELNSFIKKYVVKTGFNVRGARSSVKWKEVAKDYSGFEFLNYEEDSIRNFYWDEELVEKEKSKLTSKFDMFLMDKYSKEGYYDWCHYFDIISGCIWDVSIIESIEPID